MSMELALINSARQRARLDLMGVMVLQMQINSAAILALGGAAEGFTPERETVDAMRAASEQLSAKVQAWIDEAETFFA